MSNENVNDETFIWLNFFKTPHQSSSATTVIYTPHVLL
jgi:hypothetical protein